MFHSQSTVFADDVLMPETRDELRGRLGIHAPNERGSLSGATRSEQNRGKTFPGGGNTPGSGSFISPMTREPNEADSFDLPNAEETAPSLSPQIQSPSQLWQHPKARLGSKLGLGLCALLWFAWTYWPVSANEAPVTGDPMATDKSEVTTPQPKTAIPPEESTSEEVDVVISSSPDGAQVLIDGKPFDKKTPIQLKLQPGEHSLAIVKPGYKSIQTKFQVENRTDVQYFDNYQLPRKTTQVVISVGFPNSVSIQVDDEVTRNTNRVSGPLTLGFHTLKVFKDNYETYEDQFEVVETDEQKLPEIQLNPISLPVHVTSEPPGALIFSEGETTNSETPKTLPDYFSKDDITVKLPGYHFGDPKETRARGKVVLHFTGQQNIPPVTTAMDYGFDLKPAENHAIAFALGKLLDENWTIDSEKAVRDAHRYFIECKRSGNYDPRVAHGHGLRLWHQGKIREAQEILTEAEELERNRPGRKVPYYPLTRDKIRLESVTGDEEIAIQDLVDLIDDTARTLDQYPQDGLNQAWENADFAGRLLGFLEGPVKERLSGVVNPRLIASQIEARLPTGQLKEVFQSARQEIQNQYEEELENAAAQQKARQEKEEALQKSGELGRRSIRAKDNRLNGRHDRVDYNAQTVTPYRIPTGPRQFVTDGGPFGRTYFGSSYGPVGDSYFGNLLFASGPAVSKTIFNKRTNDLNRFLRKEDLEKLPLIQRRRPQALTTYMPQNLERKRRDLLRSVPQPTEL